MDAATELITTLLTPVVQVGIIMGIAEVIKKLGLDHKYIPLIDLAMGLIIGLVVYTAHLHFSPVEGIVVGVALGLSACGLFSGVKNLTQE